MSEVLLRQLITDDAEDLFGLVAANREQLAKFWWESTTQTPDDSRAFIEAVNHEEAMNGAPTRGIEVDGDLIGVAALHTVDWENRQSLFGYWIDKHRSGRGYATAAVQLLLDEAFDTLGLEEVRITARISNQRSLHIAEKLGFSLLKVDDEPVWQTEEKLTCATYGLTAEIYRRQQASVS